MAGLGKLRKKVGGRDGEMKGGMVLAQEYLPTLPINQNGQRITSVKRDLYIHTYIESERNIVQNIK